MRNSKSFFLSRLKDKFPVPDFFVLEGDFLKDIFAGCGKKPALKFLEILTASAPDNFLKTGETFIVRSLHPMEGDFSKSFSGIFSSEIFKFPSGAFLSSRKVFESYFSKLAMEYSGRKRAEKPYALMFQKYIRGINGAAAFFCGSGDFFSHWPSKGGEERFFLRKNGNSYFSDFEASFEAGDLLSLLSLRAKELSETIGYRNVLIEFVVSKGELFIVQACPYSGVFPESLQVRFENEANYDFSPLDMDAAFVKNFFREAGLESRLNFQVKKNGLFLELDEILNMEKELAAKANSGSFLLSFKDACLNSIKSALSSVCRADEPEKCLLALKNLNSRMALMNFVLTRIAAVLGRKKNSKERYLDFWEFRFSLKKHYNSAALALGKKILSVRTGLDYDKLSKICKIPYKDALLYISGRKSAVLRENRIKRADFILRPAYPIKGIELSPGKAQGIVRIIRNPADAEKCREDEIAVSPYMDRNLVSAAVRSRGVITSAGGFFSHAAILAREMKKPCIGAIAACDRIFSNGDRVRIENGLIFKL